MVSVYKNKTNNNVTLRDYESMSRYIRLIQWGRRNPIQFIELVFGIVLMDYQKWLIAMSWTAEYVVWACSRNAGKSFLVGCFMMARNLLFPHLQTQVISEQWQTANDTFKKMEDIATNNIKTIISTNTVFIDELERTKSDSDGFSHDTKAGYRCTLQNGSSIQTIAGASRSARGKRSNMNIYDEAGFINKDTYDITEPYMAQNSEFKLGANFDADIYPKEIPNIRLYVGSASDTNSYFYAKYKEGTKQMLAGNRKYFVADINCEVPKAPTVNGKRVGALLQQSEIDRKMRENEIAAMREYYNIFDHFDLEDSVVSRSDIITNTEMVPPALSWAGRKHRYIITYDPASKRDNAPVLVTEIYKNAEGKPCGRFIHMENLVVTYGDGSKRPMRLDEQVKRLWELIYEYNGRDKVAPYENIKVLIDNGVGGQAPALVQELCKDWVDRDGHTHPGIYDENNQDSVRWAENYRNCKPECLMVLEPRAERNNMFEAAKLLVPSGGIKFPPPCPKYDTLVLDDGTERRLTRDEMNSLIQMDLMKEEMISMVRLKSPSGNITYQLPPEKKRKMNDDRNYTAVMSCWYVRKLRDEEDFGDVSGITTERWMNATKGDTTPAADAAWTSMLSGSGGIQSNPHRKVSPFQGSSPFVVGDN